MAKKPTLSMDAIKAGVEIATAVLGSHAKPEAQLKAEKLLNECLDDALELALAAE